MDFFIFYTEIFLLLLDEFLQLNILLLSATLFVFWRDEEEIKNKHQVTSLILSLLAVVVVVLIKFLLVQTIGDAHPGQLTENLPAFDLLKKVAGQKYATAEVLIYVLLVFTLFSISAFTSFALQRFLRWESIFATWSPYFALFLLYLYAIIDTLDYVNWI